MTSGRRVAMYVMPVAVVSVALNIPKFMETQATVAHDNSTEIEVAATGSGEFKILEIEFLPPPAGEGNGEFTLVWESTPGRVYTVFFNSDLDDPTGSWSDLGDDFEADEGASTTLTFPHPDPGAERLFFIVQLNPG